MSQNQIKHQRILLPKDCKIFLKKKILGLKILNYVMFLPTSLCAPLVDYCLMFRMNKSYPSRIRSLLGTLSPFLQQNFQSTRKDFQEILVLKGVGFRVSVSDSILLLHIGFSHTISLNVPSTIKVFCPTKTTILLQSSNLGDLKNFCFVIQRQKPVDAYKGKGIFYRTQFFKAKTFKK